MDSSHRITFVAPGELAKFLEYEAEQRLATISSTAQQLLSEAYLRDHAASESTRSVDAQLSLIAKHSDKIDYRGVNVKHPYRVELPEKMNWGRKYEYYNERTAAAKALKRWYE
jgi:hypothetical protein